MWVQVWCVHGCGWESVKVRLEVGIGCGGWGVEMMWAGGVAGRTKSQGT